MDNKFKGAYELMFIADVANGTEATEATVNKFVGLIEANGEIVDKAEWGKRRFEYPINDKKEGYYVVVTFRTEPAFPAELERLLNIDESVMRSLILKLDEEIVEKVIKRAAEKAAAAEAAAAQEAPAEEAPAEETVAAEEPVVEAAPAEEATEEKAE